MRHAAIVLATLSAAVGLSAAPGLHAQQDSSPPAAVLKSGAVTQKGLQGSYCWDTTCADYIVRWPRAKEVAPGARGRIRFKLAERPEDLSLDVYKDIDDNDFPKGDPKQLRHRLRRHEVNGELVAFDALFRFPQRTGHAYMTIFGRWPDHGDSSWFFHVRLRG